MLPVAIQASDHVPAALGGAGCRALAQFWPKQYELAFEPDSPMRTLLPPSSIE